MKSVRELAAELGVSERAVRKRAQAALESGGVMRAGEGSYRVRRLGRGYGFEPLSERIEAQESDKAWMRASKAKRKEAMLKADLVKLWSQRPPGESYAKFIEGLPRRFGALKITESSFFRWVAKAKEAQERGIPPAYALLDTRGGTRTRKLTKEMEDEIVRMILENPHRKVMRIWEYLKMRFSDAPSYVTVERFVKRWRERNVLVYEFAKNPDRAVSRYRPAGGRMDEGVTYKNRLWELDATVADVVCSDGKRYILSAAIDVYTRRAVVVLEEKADFTTLGRLFKKAIKKLGVPEEVKTDNGRDYTSNNFDLMCARLRINHVLVPPYSGYYKPFIERFFRTLSHELFEELPGYVGHNVAEREDLVSRKSFKERLEAIERWRERYKNGDEFARRFALKKENRGLEVEVPLSREELQSWIDRWCERYENRYHSGIKTTPMKRWQSCPMPARRVSDERILDILTGFSVVRKVRKKGIQWMGIDYWSEKLWDKVGESVYVLADDDLGKIYVYDMEMNFVCVAESAEHGGQSRAEYIRATKRFDAKLRRLAKLIEEIRAEAPRRMQESIAEALETSGEEIGVEFKEVQRPLIEALEESGEEVHEELKSDEVTPVVNGKPVFKTPYERFVYELRHDCVSDKTRKLAEIYKEAWESAKKDAKKTG